MLQADSSCVGNVGASLIKHQMSDIASSIVSRLQSIVSTSDASNSDTSKNGKPPILSTQQDTKKIIKLYKSTRSLMNMLVQKGMNLRSSPPFIIQLINDTREYLFSILVATPNILEDNEYLQLFVTNFMSKCKDAEGLFTEFGKEMFDPHSQGRKRLIKKSLIFSHMHHELKAEFPNHKFVGEHFRFTKTQAALFWKNNFDSASTVSWNKFRVALDKLNSGLHVGTTANLKMTLDLTRNDNISNYEFDIFTRLFNPWDKMIDTWHLLSTHPAYAVFMTYEEVMERLRTKRPGSFMFRMSATNMGNWAIGYIANDGKTYQTIPKNKSIIEALVEGIRAKYYVYPDGQADSGHSEELQRFLSTYNETRIHVDSEQQRLYSEIGTTYELCKICDERDKNVRLEPCDHLLCSVCLKSWQESSTETSTCCPFCREVIRGTEHVVLSVGTGRRNTSNAPKVRAPSRPQPSKTSD
ncbi:E3 ubiquitin-protein ligase CBL [Aphelenchoides besseyi]|nr:E3 ubiquitin-protein ligase CBL [Aphelenchoides besseyi]